MRAGAVSGPGDPYARADAQAFVAADPLHVDEDAPLPGTRPALPVLDDAARSTDPSICPFLRRDAGGALLAPGGMPADDNTCVAIGAPRLQSQRQQELVCLREAHSDCPRYQRGALVAAPAGPPRHAPAVPRSTLAALLILVLSAGISFGFVVQRGGIAMPVAGGSPVPASGAVVAQESPDATGVPVETEAALATGPGGDPSSSASAIAAGSLDPSPPQEASPAPTASPTPIPTPSPIPTATASPKPRPTATPTSTRYKLLVPCPDKKSCYIYTVHSGDNLFSIAKYFGHPLSTIYAWNPQYPARRLRVGDPIRMPPPTR